MPRSSPRPIPTLFPLLPPLEGERGEKVWGGAVGGRQGRKNEKKRHISTVDPRAKFRRAHDPLLLDARHGRRAVADPARAVTSKAGTKPRLTPPPVKESFTLWLKSLRGRTERSACVNK
jgi:hypothetical protein